MVLNALESAKRFLADIALLAVGFAVAAGSVVIPKSRGRIVFFSTFNKGGFSGNLRSVFLKLSTTEQPAPIWLTNNPSTCQRLSEQGRTAHLYRTFPLWDLLRAETILLDGYAPYITFGRFKMIQLWHGSGFKHIGLANPHVRGLRSILKRSQYQAYALIAANSADDQVRKAKSFNNARVVVTGSPRNDLLFDESQGNAFRDKLGLSRYNQIVSYCPTFRDIGDAKPFDDGFWTALQNWLSTKNAAFVVKKHPSDRSLTIPKDLKGVIDLTNATDDVQDLLAITDILITDYSSISVDFALLGRPMIFYTYDLEEYLNKSRSLYYDIRTTLPGPFCRHQSELIDLLSDVSWSQTPYYQTQRLSFQKQFHAHADANATERVLRYIAEGAQTS